MLIDTKTARKVGDFFASQTMNLAGKAANFLVENEWAVISLFAIVAASGPKPIQLCRDPIGYWKCFQDCRFPGDIPVGACDRHCTRDFC